MTPPHPHFAQLRTGVRLHYAELEGAAPAVFLHGYSDSWYSYDALLGHLSPAIHAFALTQRGHGESSRPNDYAMTRFADDVIAFMDELGVQETALVGHSMGSFVARAVALTYPDRVTRLALLGTGLRTDNQGIRELAQAIDDLGDDLSREFVYDFQRSTLHRAIDPARLDALVTESLRMPPPVWRQVLAAFIAYNDSERLNTIAMPTWIAWGAEDQIFTRAEQDELVARIPKAKLTVYDQVGHGVHWEIPDRCGADLVAFLSE